MKHNWSGLLAAGLVLLLGGTAWGAPVLSIGHYDFGPDQTGQTIGIYASGGDLVEGLTLYVSIIGSEEVPTITGWNVIDGTIFEFNHFEDPVGGIEDGGRWMWVSLLTDIGTGPVSANGLVATLTLSTVGAALGSYGLALSYDGVNSDFAGIEAVLEDGSLTVAVIPEPASMLLLAVGGSVLGCIRRKRKPVAA